MTRFQMELNGLLGDYWKKSAEAELNRMRADYVLGKINIIDGVAYNSIGRVVMDDMAEKIELAGLPIDREATADARAIEVEKSIREYRESMKNHQYDAEELYEMRAAFGEGTKVVDVFTGRTIQL